MPAEPTTERADWTPGQLLAAAGQYATAVVAVLAILAVGARRGLGPALMAFVLIVALGVIRHDLGRLP